MPLGPRLSRILGRLSFRTSLRTLVRELTPRQLLPLGLAIFTLFSVLGLMTDVMGGARDPILFVVANSALAGAVAIGYAFGSMRRNRALIAGSVLLQVVWIAWSRKIPNGLAPFPENAFQARLAFDAGMTLLVVLTSYSCFLWFINGTAARYLGARAEIELAHQIHQVLVPPVAASVGEFEFHGFSIPSGEVGGDLVDIVTLRSDGAGGDAWLPPSPLAEGAQDPPSPQAVGTAAAENVWFSYVADVSGHGVSSGVVMGMFKSALRMRLLQGGPLSALLDDLNTVLFPLKSGAMYVTTCCVRGRRACGTLEYAVAGHLPILHRRAATGIVEEVTTPQIPIGMFEDYRFTSATLVCDRGDLVALITDGLTEVFDARDEQLGMEPVKAILCRLADRPLEEISSAIVAAARAHGAQLDDQTLLLIRRL